MGTEAALTSPSIAARSEVDRMTRKLALGALLVAAVAATAACQSQEQKKDETKAAGTGGAAEMTEDERTVYVIGQREEPGGHGYGQGPLSRDLDRRDRVRQLDQAGRARGLRAERRDRLLDGGRPEDEGGGEGPSRLPLEHRLW